MGTGSFYSLLVRGWGLSFTSLGSRSKDAVWGYSVGQQVSFHQNNTPGTKGDWKTLGHFPSRLRNKGSQRHLWVFHQLHINSTGNRNYTVCIQIITAPSQSLNTGFTLLRQFPNSILEEVTARKRSWSSVLCQKFLGQFWNCINLKADWEGRKMIGI